MLQPKQKAYAKTLKNGIHQVFIASITETKDGLILKFSNGNGSISRIMEINNHLHNCLCEIAYLAGIKGNNLKLIDFINRGVEIEIINDKVRYITKYGQSRNL